MLDVFGIELPFVILQVAVMHSVSGLSSTSSLGPAANGLQPSAVGGDEKLQQTFQETVAGLFFGELVKSLRSTVGEPAYLHGGQAERMFESQMDQYLVEDLAQSTGQGLVGDLYRQFRVQLQLPVEAVPQASPNMLHSSTGSSSWRGGEPHFSGRSSLHELGTRPSADLTHEPSVQSIPTSQTTVSSPAVEASELLRQARSSSNRTSDTIATTALGGMFRK